MKIVTFYRDAKNNIIFHLYSIDNQKIKTLCHMPMSEKEKKFILIMVDYINVKYPVNIQVFDRT